MLMAHGFMRRIFEIFDRYRNQRRHGLHIRSERVAHARQHAKIWSRFCDELRQFSEVTVEENQAIVCLVGENIRHTPGIAGRAFQVLSNKNIRMISQGASLLNLGFVIADRDLTDAVVGSAQRIFFRTRSGGICLMPDKNNLALVGYGKMGRLIEQLAPEYDFEVDRAPG